MGTVRNEMTIVHDWNKDRIEKLREDAIKVFSEVIRRPAGVEEYIENMISPIMKSYINQEYTFVINGDCSKLGWETSERFHEVRMEWCEKHKYAPQNIIVINFGEGDEPCRIVFDNNAESKVKDVLGDTINSEGDYHHALRLLNGLSSVTEQEIVKPYLEKIRAELKAMSGDIETIADVLAIIDKYKAESEG